MSKTFNAWDATANNVATVAVNNCCFHNLCYEFIFSDINNCFYSFKVQLELLNYLVLILRLFICFLHIILCWLWRRNVSNNDDRKLINYGHGFSALCIVIIFNFKMYIFYDKIKLSVEIVNICIIWSDLPKGVLILVLSE